jgi:plastocyanin
MSRRAASLLGVVFLLMGGAALWGAAASATSSSGVRTVHITIHYSRFDTADIPVKPGGTVRFVIENTDPIRSITSSSSGTLACSTCTRSGPTPFTRRPGP